MTRQSPWEANRRKAAGWLRSATIPVWMAWTGLIAGLMVITFLAVHPDVLIGCGVVAAGTGAVWLLVKTKEHQARATAMANVNVADFQRMSPKHFEYALANLCKRDGCTQVRVVGGAGDLGADVIATTPDGRRIVIQAKRYATKTKVGSPEVQKVGGTYSVIHRAHLAAVVTTSSYTPAAVSYARQAGIRLLAAPELAAWASRTGPAPWQ